MAAFVEYIFQQTSYLASQALVPSEDSHSSDKPASWAVSMLKESLEKRARWKQIKFWPHLSSQC